MSTIKQQYDNAIRTLTATGAAFELGTETVAGVEHRVYRNAPRNLGEIYAQAAAYGAREFLVYEGERWSFDTLLAQAAAIAQALRRDCGIAAGDHVAIAMRNYPEWMSAFIAITAIGAVAVPLNSWGQSRELAFALDDAGAKALFCDQQRCEQLDEHISRTGLPTIVARPAGAALPATARRLQDFISGADGASLGCADVGPDDPAMMMYTAGTTGQPKGARSTHRAICQAIMNFDCAAAASAMINPQAIGAMMQKGFAPAQMLAVPLFHVSGCHAVFLTGLRAGRRIVMMHKWDVARALQLIGTERVTALSAAPGMLTEMLESPLLDRADISSLSGLGGGGAATPPRTARLLMEKVPDGYPGTGWGMTETNASGSSFTGTPFRERPGSAGFLHPTVELRVCDDDGHELPQGEAGKLWLRTPTLVSGYWNRPASNAVEFRDGWFDTGDIGYLDSEGYLFLSDRAKDMVIRGGENIYPAEIEAALMECPGIAEVAAFGVPDSVLGEQLAVAVYSRDPRLGAAAIRDFAAERLAHFKVPHFVWLHGAPLPRNAAGKVLKKELKTSFARTDGSIGRT